RIVQTVRAAKPPPDPNNDRCIKAGLLALGTAIGNPIGKGNFKQNVPVIRANEQGKGFYFLWSLERVAVAYGLDTIGKKDWYGWGTELLLLKQAPDGGWNSQVDTCFALLFLRRANLAEDLTATLRGTVSDPGEVNLRAGGVGGA